MGLLHVQGGQCFATIIDALTRLRIYNIYWQKLNASDYGVPQHRPRIFIVGILKVWDIGFSFPQPIKCRDIQHFLSPRVGRPSWANMPLSNVARTNVMRGLEHWQRSFQGAMVYKLRVIPRTCKYTVWRHNVFGTEPSTWPLDYKQRTLHESGGTYAVTRFPLELPVACDTFAVWPVVGQQHVC